MKERSEQNLISNPASSYWLVQNQNGRCALALERDGWLYVIAEEGRQDAHLKPPYSQAAKEALAHVLLSEIHGKAGLA